MRLKTPKITKISWGSIPPDPPTVKDCMAAMFSTSANNFAPPGKAYMTVRCRNLTAAYFGRITVFETLHHCSIHSPYEPHPYRLQWCFERGALFV